MTCQKSEECAAPLPLPLQSFCAGVASGSAAINASTASTPPCFARQYAEFTASSSSSERRPSASTEIFSLSESPDAMMPSTDGRNVEGVAARPRCQCQSASWMSRCG
jgi:hypothetical protein